jgi:opacity protein-like surface antigen
MRDLGGARGRKWRVRDWTVAATLTLALAGCVNAATHVSGYLRSDGTYVAPHYRSDADGIASNNWSAKGNVNPYTGQVGTKNAGGSESSSGYSINPGGPEYSAQPTDSRQTYFTLNVGMFGIKTRDLNINDSAPGLTFGIGYSLNQNIAGELRLGATSDAHAPQADASVSPFGSALLRMGTSVLEPTRIYGLIGATRVDARISSSIPAIGLNPAPYSIIRDASTGLTLGGGIERRFGDGAIGLEYVRYFNGSGAFSGLDAVALTLRW